MEAFIRLADISLLTVFEKKQKQKKKQGLATAFISGLCRGRKILHN